MLLEMRFTGSIKMLKVYRESLAIHAAMVLLCIILGTSVLQYNSLLIFGIFLFFGMLLLMLIWPESATLVVIFAIYANLPVIATRFYGIPQPVAAAVVLLLALPVIFYLTLGREKLLVGQPFLLMLAFLVVLFASSLFAKDRTVAVNWILTFLLEGLVLYWLIINAVRTLATLRRVIWALLLAGSLLGALSLYQEVTGSYDNRFGGLAQKQSEPGTDTLSSREEVLLRIRAGHRDIQRARGPVGEPNRYAQIMLVLLPLALLRFWGERSLSMRMCAVVATVLILSGVLLTYSRGAFVALVLLLLMTMFMRYIRPAQLLTALAVLILTMALVAPGYFARVSTIRNVEGLVSDEAAVKPDGAIRGRATEMLAGLLAFLDHPILGVGPGQYEPFYSKAYHLTPDIAFRNLPRPRPAHTLYFQIAAETGAIGLAIFMAIVLWLMYQLWQARRRWANSRPDLANIAAAFLLSLMAYLGSAIFLHFAYQRYYWLLLALVGAALQIFRAANPPRELERLAEKVGLPQGA